MLQRGIYQSSPLSSSLFPCPSWSCRRRREENRIWGREQGDQILEFNFISSYYLLYLSVILAMIKYPASLRAMDHHIHIPPISRRETVTTTTFGVFYSCQWPLYPEHRALVSQLRNGIRIRRSLHIIMLNRFREITLIRLVYQAPAAAPIMLFLCKWN